LEKQIGYMRRYTGLTTLLRSLASRFLT
jgi:hypothetical protein